MVGGVETAMQRLCGVPPLERSNRQYYSLQALRRCRTSSELTTQLFGCQLTLCGEELQLIAVVDDARLLTDVSRYVLISFISP